MTIRFTCPHCQAPITAPDTAAGKEGPCPQCKGTVEAPLQITLTPLPETPQPPPVAVAPTVPSTKTCPNCGKTIRAEAVFCRHCRVNLPAAAGEDPSSFPLPSGSGASGPARAAGGVKRKPLVIALGVIGLLIFLAITFHDYQAAGRGGTDNSGGAAGTATTTSGQPVSRLQLLKDEWVPSELGATIEGTVQNNTNASIPYAQIDYILYDESGAQVGKAWANITDLEPHGVWKFSASVTENNVAKYKLSYLGEEAQ
ncbi:MAG: FxLYD domain-containing protein [Armatimonadota bacterium]